MLGEGEGSAVAALFGSNVGSLVKVAMSSLFFVVVRFSPLSSLLLVLIYCDSERDRDSDRDRRSFL